MILGIKIVLPSIAAVMSLILIIYLLFKGKKTGLLYTYISCQIVIFIMSTGQILEILTQGTPIWIWFVKYEYLAMCYAGAFWLLFCLVYTENRLVHNKRFVLFLFIPPTIFYTSLLFNEYHRLFFIKDEPYANGILFWVQLYFIYVYIGVSMGLLVRHFIKQANTSKKQAALLLFSVLIPIMLNVMFNVFKISPSKFDLTPTSMSFSSLLLAIAAFKYKFLNIMPVALSKIFDNIEEAIIVVDSANRVVDFNKQCTWAVRNCEMSIVAESLRQRITGDDESLRVLEAIAHDTAANNFSGEINLTVPEKRCFFVKIRPIPGGREKTLGRIISFNDISQYKNLLEEIRLKNMELSDKNEQLREYAATVEELAIARERNRFARDMHDTLGHTMTLLLTLMKVSKIRCRSNPDEAEEKLSEGIDIASGGLKELRRSILGLTPRKLEDIGLANSLRQLAAEATTTETTVSFSFQGTEIGSKLQHAVIYRICQEAITNSIRHGKAERVEIMLRMNEQWINLFVIDDGAGCKSIQKGFGLSGMEERVKNLNGTIKYGSSGDRGFNIHVEIPTEEASH